MARVRQIKPGFFLNEDLAAVSPIGRLMFAGLWTIADREGRLEDRPAKLRAAVLPYDRADGEKLISQLAERGFLLRYEVDGDHYLQIVNFTVHQKPHPKEAPSTIPAPFESESRVISAPSSGSTGKLHGKTPASSALPSESSSPSLPSLPSLIDIDPRASAFSGDAQAVYRAMAESLNAHGTPMRWAETWLETRTLTQILDAIGKAREKGAGRPYVDAILEKPPASARKTYAGQFDGTQPLNHGPYEHLINRGA